MKRVSAIAAFAVVIVLATVGVMTHHARYQVPLRPPVETPSTERKLDPATTSPSHQTTGATPAVPQDFGQRQRAFLAAVSDRNRPVAARYQDALRLVSELGSMSKDEQAQIALAMIDGSPDICGRLLGLLSNVEHVRLIELAHQEVTLLSIDGLGAARYLSIREPARFEELARTIVVSSFKSQDETLRATAYELLGRFQCLGPLLERDIADYILECQEKPQSGTGWTHVPGPTDSRIRILLDVLFRTTSPTLASVAIDHLGTQLKRDPSPTERELCLIRLRSVVAGTDRGLAERAQRVLDENTRED